MAFIQHYGLFKGLIERAAREEGQNAADEAAYELMMAAVAVACRQMGPSRCAAHLSEWWMRWDQEMLN